MEGEALTRYFSEEEVKQAIWDCEGSKSPGPDGFNFTFYKTCWHIIKNDLMRVFWEFHDNGKLMRGSNSSYIVLIPIREGASGIDHFRPISLVGSLFKIITKVLAGRLKLVMNSLIRDTQSAFLKARNILDGVVTLNEVVEEAKKTKKSVDGVQGGLR